MCVFYTRNEWNIHTFYHLQLSWTKYWPILLKPQAKLIYKNQYWNHSLHIAQLVKRKMIFQNIPLRWNSDSSCRRWNIVSVHTTRALSEFNQAHNSTNYFHMGQTNLLYKSCTGQIIIFIIYTPRIPNFLTRTLTVCSCPPSLPNNHHTDLNNEQIFAISFSFTCYVHQKITWHLKCSLCPNIVMYESSSVMSSRKVAILGPVLLLSRSGLILRSDTHTPNVHCSSSCTVGI